MKKFIIVVLFSIFSFSSAYSQDSLRTLINSLIPVSPVTITGYVDAYYSHDNDLNDQLERFPAVNSFRDQYRLNLAQISAKYLKDNVRGNFTIQYGDIPDILWPSNQKFIQEANVGFSPGKDFWIDAGYFLTHIGTEGIKPIDNVFSNFAMITYYEPFPQAGVTFSYYGKQFTGVFHILNGYNVLADNNKNKSLGLTLAFKPAKNIDVIYNNLSGNESPDLNYQKLRFYNNLIFKGTFGKWNVILNNDFAMQQYSKIGDTTSYGSMFGGFLTAKYTINPKFALSFRGEYFMDSDGIFSGVYTNTANEKTGLQLFGPSLAFEYKPMPNAYLRLEGRYLKTMKDLKIFSDDRDYRMDGSVSMGVLF